MKLKVQDGSSLSGSQLQMLVARLPARFLRRIESIFVGACWDPLLKISYIQKHRSLALHVPSPPYAAPLPIETVVHELLIALAVIAERGDLPSKLSKPLRLRAIQEMDEFMALVPNLALKRTGLLPAAYLKR